MDKPYQPFHLEGVDNRNYDRSSNMHSNQVAHLVQQCYPSHSPKEISETETEIPMVLLVILEIITIDVVVMVVQVVHQVVVMVVLQTVHMELVQIAPLPQHLGEDVDVTDVVNSMTNLNRV